MSAASPPSNSTGDHAFVALNRDPRMGVLVDKMLDMAKVTLSDYLVDLGSGVVSAGSSLCSLACTRMYSE